MYVSKNIFLAGLRNQLSSRIWLLTIVARKLPHERPNERHWLGGPHPGVLCEPPFLPQHQGRQPCNK